MTSNKEREIFSYQPPPTSAALSYWHLAAWFSSPISCYCCLRFCYSAVKEEHHQKDYLNNFCVCILMQHVTCSTSSRQCDWYTEKLSLEAFWMHFGYSGYGMMVHSPSLQLTLIYFWACSATTCLETALIETDVWKVCWAKDSSVSFHSIFHDWFTRTCSSFDLCTLHGYQLYLMDSVENH